MYAAGTTCKPYAPDAAAERLSARAEQLMLPAEQRHTVIAPAPAYADRLRQLEAAIAAADARARRFRTPREETEMLLMRRPLTTERAYEYFGLLLGALPPAAIFYRLSNYVTEAEPSAMMYFIFLFSLMNVACCLAGWRMGVRAGRRMERVASASRIDRCCNLLAAAIIWGACTGSLGGLLFFGVGSFIGTLVALPVALVAFILFALLHRFLARGGMIDARHFWPVACGITLVISALILNLGK